MDAVLPLPASRQNGASVPKGFNECNNNQRFDIKDMPNKPNAQ